MAASHKDVTSQALAPYPGIPRAECLGIGLHKHMPERVMNTLSHPPTSEKQRQVCVTRNMSVHRASVMFTIHLPDLPDQWTTCTIHAVVLFQQK